MPIPFIIAGAAIAAGVYGGKKAYDGHQTKSEANEILKTAQRRLKRAEREVKAAEETTQTKLESLGEIELALGTQISKFDALAKDLLEKLGEDQKNLNFKISLPKNKIEKIQTFSYNATQFMQDAATGVIGGAAASFATYSGVMAFGAASTGTAISSLSGVAATNATLAAIGGGSLATGGLGMAGGTAILGGAALAPVLLVGGLAYNAHANKAREKASEASEESRDIARKYKKIEAYHENLQDYISKVDNVVKSLGKEFSPFLNELKMASNVIKSTNKSEDREFAEHILERIDAGYMLASVIVDIVTTPLFMIESEVGEQLEYVTDSNGNALVNEEAIDAVLATV